MLTSPGPAAIAVIRARGAPVAAFLEQHIRTTSAIDPAAWQPGRIQRAALLDAAGDPIDDILVSVHAPAPAWDVRLHLHGNPWLVRRCAEILRAGGFSDIREEQSTLWTAADALEAEAYALLPQVLTLRGAHWLLHQVQRLRATLSALLNCGQITQLHQTCRAAADRAPLVTWFTKPLRVVLAGPPNTGKSTLANALADRVVSVVSSTPGTTRDWVEVPGEADGFPVTWLDTAGLRDSADELEQEGAGRTRQLVREANAVVMVLDVTSAPPRGFLKEHEADCPACVVLNKCDLGVSMATVRECLPPAWRSRVVHVSALARSGLDALSAVLLASAGRAVETLDLPAAFTPRQVRLLSTAATAGDVKAIHDNILQCFGGSSGCTGARPGGLQTGPAR